MRSQPALPHATAPRHRGRHLLAAAALASLAAVGLQAAPASAHVEPTVTEVAAGSEATLTFEVEHGCGESPTVRVDIKAPDTVTDPTPVDKAGWNSSVADGVVTFEWAGTDGQEDGTFEVGFTAPDAAGETLLFPTVQTCAEGSYDWIQEDADGDRPAPRVVVVAGSTPDEPATTATTAAPDDGGTTTADAEETTTTVDGSGAATDDADDDADGGSNAALLAVGVIVVIAVVGGGVVLARRRSGQGS